MIAWTIGAFRACYCILLTLLVGILGNGTALKKLRHCHPTWGQQNQWWQPQTDERKRDRYEDIKRKMGKGRERMERGRKGRRGSEREWVWEREREWVWKSLWERKVREWVSEKDRGQRVSDWERGGGKKCVEESLMLKLPTVSFLHSFLRHKQRLWGL